MTNKSTSAMVAIREAEKATARARMACAEASSYVATYLGNRQLTFIATDLEKSAELTSRIALHLRIAAEELQS